MAKIERFEDLETWKLARELSSVIYSFTLEPPFSSDFDLKYQIRKSSGSIMDNIAEGFERGGNKEFIQFLGISKGSAGEVRSQLYRCLDRQYISEENFKIVYEKSLRISKQLSQFIQYLKTSQLSGFKYNQIIKNRACNPQP